MFHALYALLCQCGAARCCQLACFIDQVQDTSTVIVVVGRAGDSRIAPKELCGGALSRRWLAQRV